MATASYAAEAVTLHVSPGGSDANNGMTVAQALASPAGARDRVRALRTGDRAGAPVHVLFHAGVYGLAETFVLEPRDGGTAEAPVVYEAAAGERVVWSGGTRLDAFSDDGDGTWSCALPAWAAAGDAPAFRSLWIADERGAWAGHPEPGHFLHIESIPESDRGAKWTDGPRAFTYAPADAAIWERVAPGAEVVTFTRWVDTHLRVAAIDRSARTVRFTSPNAFELQPGDLYRIEGAPGLLDAPGEWCTGAEGRLRLRAAAAPAAVVAPRLSTLLRIAGDAAGGHLVEHVTFRGIAFEHARWWFDAGSAVTWPSKDVIGFVQAAFGAPGAIVADGARHLSVEECQVAHVEAYGIELRAGCTGCAIRRCILRDLGAGGVKIGTPAIAAPALVTQGNTVEDCTIADGGRIHHQAVGIWIGQSGGNHIAHNLIRDFDYTGISIGWTWGYGPSQAIGNIVEWNEVCNLGARARNAEPPLGDMAGIYTLGTQADAAVHTTIRRNYFHDIAGRSIAWGIYFDEGSTGIVAEENVVLRTTHGSFHQHYGRDNTMRNNILLLGRDAQLWRTRREEHNSFTLERNIVVRATGALLQGDWSGGFVSRGNVFWSLDGKVVFPGGATLDAWARQAGDQGSVVADPHAMPDSSTPWTLGAGSGAAVVGFVPFDLTGVGPRPK